MKPIITIQQASQSLLISKPSYYRLAAEGQLPPPIKVSANRSGVFEHEIEAIIRARAAGANDDEVLSLVSQLIEKRITKQ